MALKATIFKAELHVADIDRGYYQAHSLTLARHPSETEQRMMVRLLAFALHAHERLLFGRGLSTDDEPDLWLKNLHDEVELWIELGQPDEKRIRKTCARAKNVIIYTYQHRSAQVWWEQQAKNLRRFDNLSVRHLPEPAATELASLAQRNMQLQCTIEGEHCWLGDTQHTVAVTLQHRL